MNHADKSFIFFSTWIILGLLNLLFLAGKNTALKRKWHPYIVISTALLFIAFLIWTDTASGALFLLPAIVFISFINIKFVKFCDSCGSTLYNRNWFQKMESCRKCGKSLLSRESQ